MCWDFLFIGANIDAVQTVAHFGISRDRAVNYRADSQGTQALSNTVSETVCAMRTDIPFAADWGERIENDNRNRK